MEFSPSAISGFFSKFDFSNSIFRQLTKFEQRAKKLKVDDSDVHRIRKNVQTLSSNHSTMYNKLKEYCNESAELKKTLRKLTETAKRLGKPTQKFEFTAYTPREPPLNQHFRITTRASKANNWREYRFAR